MLSEVGGNKQLSKDLEESLLEISELLYDKMDKLLPDPSTTLESELIEAMRYSVLSHGKRLRPFLTVISASLFGVSKTSSLQTAAAIEFVHAYSLIHDDLPSMDDDSTRRGQPSCHIKYSESTAILAGDALQSIAFEILADQSTHYDASVRSELVRCLARAIGHRGMAGGQVLDLISETKKLSINEITRLQRMKTGALFAISCEAGAILGKANRSLRNALKGFAHDIGLAFQITDDLLDAEDPDESSQSRLDKSKDKATFVSAMGKQKARDQAEILSKQALTHLENFDERADLLRQLSNYVVTRTF